MSRNRYGKERDANEEQIVEALEKAGCLVCRGDWVDLTVQSKNNVYLIEVKGPKGQLTELQRKLIAAGWKIHICKSPEAALLAVGL